MKIAVCIKEVVDSSLSLGFGQVSDELVQKGLPFKLNPNDAQALQEALIIKEVEERIPVELTVISIGASKVEKYLLNGLTLGADSAIRIWEAGLENLSGYQKARILSRVISLSGADLVLTGARSLDNASGQVGPLIAAFLGFPCICKVESFHLEAEQGNLTVTRSVGRGMREKVSASLPVVLALTGQGEQMPYASMYEMLAAMNSQITCLSLADLGISREELKNDFIRVTGMAFPRPRPKKIPAPSSSLTAFDRILALLEGVISRRRGEMLIGNSEELADQLFELLLEKDIIKTAARQEPAAGSTEGKRSPRES